LHYFGLLLCRKSRRGDFPATLRGKEAILRCTNLRLRGNLTLHANGAANLNIKVADADMRNDREGKFSGHISVFGWQPVIITRTDNQTLPPISAIKLEL